MNPLDDAFASDMAWARVPIVLQSYVTFSLQIWELEVDWVHFGVDNTGEIYEFTLVEDFILGHWCAVLIHLDFGLRDSSAATNVLNNDGSRFALRYSSLLNLAELLVVCLGFFRVRILFDLDDLIEHA